MRDPATSTSGEELFKALVQKAIARLIKNPTDAVPWALKGIGADVMDMNMAALCDVGRRETDDLAVFEDRLAGGDVVQSQFVP